MLTGKIEGAPQHFLVQTYASHLCPTALAQTLAFLVLKRRLFPQAAMPPLENPTIQLVELHRHLLWLCPRVSERLARTLSEALTMLSGLGMPPWHRRRKVIVKPSQSQQRLVTQTLSWTVALARAAVENLEDSPNATVRWPVKGLRPDEIYMRGTMCAWEKNLAHLHACLQDV